MHRPYLPINLHGAGAARVAIHRAFDLDDLGPHGAQAARDVRAWQELAVVDDAKVCQRQRLGIFREIYMLNRTPAQ